jgi:hypothetical protein
MDAACSIADHCSGANDSFPHYCDAAAATARRARIALPFPPEPPWPGLPAICPNRERIYSQPVKNQTINSGSMANGVFHCISLSARK